MKALTPEFPFGKKIIFLTSFISILYVIFSGFIVYKTGYPVIIYTALLVSFILLPIVLFTKLDTLIASNYTFSKDSVRVETHMKHLIIKEFNFDESSVEIFCYKMVKLRCQNRIKFFPRYYKNNINEKFEIVIKPHFKITHIVNQHVKS